MCGRGPSRRTAGIIGVVLLCTLVLTTVVMHTRSGALTLQAKTAGRPRQEVVPSRNTGPAKPYAHRRPAPSSGQLPSPWNVTAGHGATRAGFKVVPYGAPAPPIHPDLRMEQQPAWDVINGQGKFRADKPPPRPYFSVPDRCCVAVVIENRKLDMLVASIASMHRHLPLYWGLHVLLPTDNIEWLMGVEVLQRIAQVREIFLTPEERAFNHNSINAYFKGDVGLWERMLGAKMLSFHTDSVMCSPVQPVPSELLGITDFLAFDYVGAPFNHLRTAAGLPLVGNGYVSVLAREGVHVSHGCTYRWAVGFRCATSICRCSVCADVETGTCPRGSVA